MQKARQNPDLKMNLPYLISFIMNSVDLKDVNPAPQPSIAQAPGGTPAKQPWVPAGGTFAPIPAEEDKFEMLIKSINEVKAQQSVLAENLRMLAASRQSRPPTGPPRTGYNSTTYANKQDQQAQQEMSKYTCYNCGERGHFLRD
ncbi:hypothetical protein V490_09213 [Pseudogymnoascus sp. VKM F-3557]|nr:hypothetical protein V490_09213 [Pseudogymnoascus sp. VKM F-3557]